MSRNAYGSPVLIQGDSKPVVLEKVSYSDTSYDEAFVQRLAFENPSCLPINEIDRAYEDLVPICMELNTPAGPIDALYVTPTGRLVILEAKL